MPDGIFIEVDRVGDITEEVRQAAVGMREAAAYAKEADPDPYMWGVVGAPLGLMYEEASSRVQAVLDRVPDAFDGVAERIDESARAIADCDAEVGRRLDGLRGEIAERGRAR